MDKNQVTEALAALTTPKAASPVNTEIVENFDWQWTLVGNETAEEKKLCDKMLFETKRFITDLLSGAEPRWLILVGDPGCGKTHLSERIRAFIRDRARNLYEATVRAKIDPGASDYRTCWSYAQEGPFLAKWAVMIDKARSKDYAALKLAASDWIKIIDDLGTNSFTEDSFNKTPRATLFVCQAMGDLLDKRLRKWTVINSNFSRRQFAEQFDSRVASRLTRHGNVIVDCTGLRDFDLRKEAAAKQVA